MYCSDHGENLLMVYLQNAQWVDVGFVRELVVNRGNRVGQETLYHEWQALHHAV